jgi:dTDP-4-amino-4,6-dideoxygalactose transaminase
MNPIAFIDLQAQRRRLGDRMRAAIDRAIEGGAYIMGPEVSALESELAARIGAKHAITCGNGTDALQLGLMALGAGPGDAVLAPSFTFAATAEVIALVGAVPIFVDVLPTFNIDPDQIAPGVEVARQRGLNPVGVITVDLFGQPADYEAIEREAANHGLWLLSDAAQSFGSVYRGRRVGTIGRVTATSFFPAKPLGCYGDGGAVFTDDDRLAAAMRSLRIHGQGSDKYDNVRVGLNSRLDTIQAAILLQKLTVFDEEIESRNAIAARYNDRLGNRVRVPRVIDGATSVWAQYTIVVPGDRDSMAKKLKAAGVPTAVYYPLPLHQQTAYGSYPTASGTVLPVSEQLSRGVLSLPMHPYLDALTQDYIINAVVASA